MDEPQDELSPPLQPSEPVPPVPPRKKGGWPKGVSRRAHNLRSKPRLPKLKLVPAPTVRVTEATVNIYQGLDQRSCCIDCIPGRCVITGDEMCGNPAFGGLQPKYALNSDVVERWRGAKKYLAMQATEKRHA